MPGRAALANEQMSVSGVSTQTTEHRRRSVFCSGAV
jgi:hypothetical protein